MIDSMQTFTTGQSISKIARITLTLALFILPLLDASGQVREMTLEALTKSSTSVVLGRAEAPRSFWNDKRTQILTEVKIRVDETVVGDIAGETVITVPGGRVGNTLYEVSDMPVFVDGEQVLVFLWEHPSGRQLVTAGLQGKLEVIEDEIGGQPKLQGAAPLLNAPDELGKTAAQTEITAVASGDVPVEDVLELIRGYAEE